MGPYCNFCGQRCFTYFPDETPEYVLNAYGKLKGVPIQIIATCPSGQKHEKERTGYCYDDIMKLIKETERCDFRKGIPDGPDHCEAPGMHNTVCLLETGGECPWDFDPDAEYKKALERTLTDAHFDIQYHDQHEKGE